jgi:DNA-binding transcriptional LysR family regulator
LNRLFDIEILVRVVRTGSYTQAARELGISKSYASKQVRGLEDRLGVRLLNRTTRTVTATDAGQRLVDRCMGLLDELEAAERDVTALQDSPRGLLRLSAPVSFGTRFIAPALAGFMERFPDLAVTADLSDRRVDLVEEGYDLAVRIGRLDDASHLARKLAPVRSCLVASPAYLAARGAPKRPEDLRDHPCMVYSLHASPTSWALTALSGGGDPMRVRVTARLTSNNGDALLAAARAGLGVAALPDFFVGDLIRSGELAWVLPEWQPMPAGGVWAVHPAGRFVPVKTRLLVEHLVEELATPPWSLPDPPQP